MTLIPPLVIVPGVVVWAVAICYLILVWYALHLRQKTSRAEIDLDAQQIATEIISEDEEENSDDLKNNLKNTKSNLTKSLNKLKHFSEENQNLKKQLEHITKDFQDTKDKIELSKVFKEDLKSDSIVYVYPVTLAKHPLWRVLMANAKNHKHILSFFEYYSSKHNACRGLTDALGDPEENNYTIVFTPPPNLN